MEGGSKSSKWVDLWREVKTMSTVGAPMVGVMVMQYLIQVVAVMMVGHFDQLSLSGATLAFSFTGVTGYTLLAGMAGGLETIGGQAYGAGEFRKLGTCTYCAMTSMMLVCIPVGVLWVFTDNVLLLAQQDTLVSAQAGVYAIYLIPGLFGFALLEAMMRYFQTQSLVLPLFFIGLATTCLHVPLCWILIFKTGLRSRGAPLAVSISNWVNVILLGIYMARSSKCARTLPKFELREVVSGTKEFFRFAVPSTLMTSLEWWSYDVLIFMAGLLANPKLETSVMSICFSFTFMHYDIPYAFGASVSTRVSNELGAGNSKAAKLAVKAVMILAMMDLAVVILPIFLSRQMLGYAFSNDKQIVEYVAEMTPFMCLSATMDTLQVVLSGVVRGTGKQDFGAFVNLGAYYLVGLPLAAALAFGARLRAKGLLIGIATGSGLQAALFGIRLVLTDWEQQAAKARERIFHGEEPKQGGI